MKVLCIKNKSDGMKKESEYFLNNITVGKYYEVTKEYYLWVLGGTAKYYAIYNDQGFLINYEAKLFKTLSEIRREKLIKLNKYF